MSDAVNHPRHYTSHPSGIEAIEVCELVGFCLGNALKYILRRELKGDEITDLRKAKWYVTRELSGRIAGATPAPAPVDIQRPIERIIGHEPRFIQLALVRIARYLGAPASIGATDTLQAAADAIAQEIDRLELRGAR